jgi:hypothetical protein
MIEIYESKTADTRSCDYKSVTKEQLIESSVQHIDDVKQGMRFFARMMGKEHDRDKITDIGQFHEDFLTGFQQTIWWDNHRKVNRHHLLQDDGVPEDVNLIDVIEMIVDCVMAGMARTGTVYPLTISQEVLKKAFDNTAELLKKEIIVKR